MDENLKKRLQELAGILSESKVSDIYEKYYQDIRLDLFHDIITADPTTPVKNGIPDKLGQYSKWLLSLHKKGKLRKEDLYKAKEYLKVYQELKNQNILPANNRDIGKINSLPELYTLNSQFGGTGQIKTDESYLLNDKYFINAGQAELFFENKRWLIIIPKSIEASKFYACTSQWCTRFPENYNNYTKDGPLYILIDKTKLNQNDANRRFQFHFESNQFMDMNDSPINVGEFMKNNPSIANVLSEAIMKYLERSTDLSETVLSLLGAMALRNPDTLRKFMPALESRIASGLKIPDSVIEMIPGLQELKIKVYSEKGWVIEEKFFLKMEPENLQQTIEKRLSKHGSQGFPAYYFRNSENKLKVYYYKDLIKHGSPLPEPIAAISDQRLVGYYTDQMIQSNKVIPTFVYNMATEAQRKIYRQNLLNNKVQFIEPEQFQEFTDQEQKIYLNKYVDRLYTFMPNKFFNVLSKELRNYYIYKIISKKGLDKVQDFLTDNQFKWASTDGFLS